ncbi:hypothetical protein KIPB_004455 [Kipferlia bialata]|uniref:RRM domain-containing protein n=1 Tax=Kipferlia bialata TaxID=797122 RepID=A0A9K3CX02_9EUKA|nr:hypothetical protein KIPB_004455 [Kipferlia bialata]|eukprot:g4455.t1
MSGHVQMSTFVEEKNPEAIIYIGDLDPQVTDDILFELLLQFAPVVKVNLPKDKLTNQHLGYGFVEMVTPEDAAYCIEVLQGIEVFGKAIKVRNTASDPSQFDIGAKLFVGSLDSEVTDQVLHEAFSQFGQILNTHVCYDESGCHRGFGFVSYNGFDQADAAIAAMNNQYLSGRVIKVSYAKKEGGKRQAGTYGSDAERLLASNQAPAGPMGMGPMGGMGGMMR